MRGLGVILSALVCVQWLIACEPGPARSLEPSPTQAPPTQAPALPPRPTAAPPALLPPSSPVSSPAAAAATPRPSLRVRTGLLGALSDSGLLIALAKGHFVDQGLDAQAVRFNSPTA